MLTVENNGRVMLEACVECQPRPGDCAGCERILAAIERLYQLEHQSVRTSSGARQKKNAGRVLAELELDNGTKFYVYESDAAAMNQYYPHVDIPVELRKMEAWLLANPRRRKTREGIRRFIFGWLSREEEGRRAPEAAPPEERGSFDTDSFFNAAVRRTHQRVEEQGKAK